MRVVTFGESMGLIRGDGIGTFTQLGNAQIDTGGAEGNVAIGLARLGVSVSWLGRVGDDSIGRRVARDLRGEGVDVHAVIDSSATTGLMLKEAPRHGSTNVLYYRSGSAGSRLSPTDLDALEVETADLLHITGISLAISPTARAAVRHAVTRARHAGIRVSFDVNHRSRLWDEPTAREVYREIASASDIVFAGDDEAALTVGAPPGANADELLSRLAELGPTEVVLKRGAAGASSWVNGAITHQSAVSVTVVDTVGAGDAFVAGYLSELLVDAPPTQRLLTGVMTGAFVCRNPSDWQGAATRAELNKYGSDPVSR